MQVCQRSEFFLLQDRYESSFLLVTGDLRKPIPANRIQDFLEILFPSFSDPISSYNIDETLHLFGRHGSKSREIFWSDIRMVIHEKNGQRRSGELLFIGSVLNPKNRWIQKWWKFMDIVAVYHFLAVPIRISFLPWSNMTEVWPLCTDLIADILIFVHIVIVANTACLSVSSTWITDKYELFRRVEIGFIISSIPMDWYSPLFYLRIPLLTISFRFGYLCGASNELSCWLRAVKLVLPYTMLFAVSRQSSKSGGGESTTAMRLIRLACIVIGIIHIGACIWFYIGSRYQVRHTIV